MKYLVVLCDGMADYPVEELGNKTPLEAAKIPNMNRLAKNSIVGLIKTVDDGLKPGSDVANLSVLGYDPISAIPDVLLLKPEVSVLICWIRMFL